LTKILKNSINKYSKGGEKKEVKKMEIRKGDVVTVFLVVIIALAAVKITGEHKSYIDSYPEKNRFL
jgi:hypothetical protein